MSSLQVPYIESTSTFFPIYVLSHVRFFPKVSIDPRSIWTITGKNEPPALSGEISYL